MLFERRLREGILDGSISMAFRRWQRSQVASGGRYRTGLDMIEVESVDVVDPGGIGQQEARRAGYPSPAALLADLRGKPQWPVYQIRFRRLDEPDARDTLAASDRLGPAEVADIGRRLDRLDRASARGPSTTATLAAIAARPGVRAADLADSAGAETAVFKRSVRVLKGMGLTLSLQTGYCLSPRGRAYVRLSGRGE
jgi:hypothetical protein